MKPMTSLLESATPADVMDERSLLLRAASGSMEALGEVYERYSGMVFRSAYGITANADEAEDVVHDVFVGLPRALDTFDHGRAFGPWLRRVAVRTALMRLRQRRTRSSREGAYTGAPSSPQGAAPEDRLAVRQAMLRLPERLRIVLVLREIEGYTHAEIARMLDITPAASAVRLHRALRALRQELRRDE